MATSMMMSRSTAWSVTFRQPYFEETARFYIYLSQADLERSLWLRRAGVQIISYSDAEFKSRQHNKSYALEANILACSWVACNE